MPLLESRWILALGWGLLHFLWQGALVGLSTAILMRVFRATEGPLRHHLACLALLGCLAAPVAGTLSSLESPRPWLHAAPAPTGQISVEIHAGDPTAHPSWPLRTRQALRPCLGPAVAIWAVGCLVMGARSLGGWLWLGRLRRRGEAASRELQELLQILAARMGLRRQTELRIVPQGSTPAIYGLWRPVLLLPITCLTGLPPAHLEALLAHELAHAARWDYAINLLQTVAEVLLFFHPAVWWISRRIRTEREQLCDDLAAKALGDPRRLALALDALDDLQPSHLSMALAAHGGTLLHRIDRLVNPHVPASSGTPWLLPALLVLGLATPLAARILREDPIPAIPMPAPLVRQVDELADREGLDRHLLRAIAFAESRFDPKARSSMGARGLLQVMPATATKYGAQDLNDPAQVAAAGARYLKVLLDRYAGDWTKAVSAYNAGEEAVEAGHLKEETLRYVPEVLRLARTKAITAETPLAANTMEGRLERLRDGTCSLDLRFRTTTPAIQIDILPATGETPLGSVRIGKDSASPTAEEFRPRIKIQDPGLGELRLRVSEPGKAPMGETRLVLDQNLRVFRMGFEPTGR